MADTVRVDPCFFSLFFGGVNCITEEIYVVSVRYLHINLRFLGLAAGQNSVFANFNVITEEMSPESRLTCPHSSTYTEEGEVLLKC